MNLPVLKFSKPKSGVKATFYNSGHSVYVYLNESASFRPNLIGGPLKDKFIFEQMHFHWGSEDDCGSEHFIDGESFGVEIHLVHYNGKYSSYDVAAEEEDGLAVLTLFAEATNDDNELLNHLCSRLSSISKAKSSVTLDSSEAMAWAGSALENNTGYYTYPGSLTTEPYTENVIFIILPTPITLSITQLCSFRELHNSEDLLIEYNKRQLQPLLKRPIVYSTKMECPNDYILL